MKTLLKLINGKIALIALFSLGAFVAQAQTPSWVVSKNVQKVANKKAFADTDDSKSQLTTETRAYAPRIVSKGVHRINNPAVGDAKATATGNMVSKGYPAWTISKGVHRSAKADSYGLAKRDNK